MFSLLILILVYGFPVFLIYMIFTTGSKKQNSILDDNHSYKRRHWHYQIDRGFKKEMEAREKLLWLLSVWTGKNQKN